MNHIRFVLVALAALAGCGGFSLNGRWSTSVGPGSLSLDVRDVDVVHLFTMVRVTEVPTQAYPACADHVTAFGIIDYDTDGRTVHLTSELYGRRGVDCAPNAPFVSYGPITPNHEAWTYQFSGSSVVMFDPRGTRVGALHRVP